MLHFNGKICPNVTRYVNTLPLKASNVIISVGIQNLKRRCTHRRWVNSRSAYCSLVQEKCSHRLYMNSGFLHNLFLKDPLITNMHIDRTQSGSNIFETNCENCFFVSAIFFLFFFKSFVTKKIGCNFSLNWIVF